MRVVNKEAATPWISAAEIVPSASKYEVKCNTVDDGALRVATLIADEIIMMIGVASQLNIICLVEFSVHEKRKK